MAGNTLHAILLIAVMAIVTALMRCLPFFLFGGKLKTSQFIAYLGKYLPYAMMGMLLIYCYKGVSLTHAPFGAPELLAGLLVVLLHIWKRNSLLSIGLGTVCYMLLIQFVF